MRNAVARIPVYTGDVSGVCSALFELGGMVVMHDPSGCNSTYNTHDEIRWYDRDSLIFLSGLREMDAIMGNDDKLVEDIVEAASFYRPAFIAIANSPIPYIIGTDFDAICRLVEDKTGIPAFYVPTNGMHDYVHGAGLAFLRIAERFVEGRARKGANRKRGSDAGPSAPIRCNILGMTPLDFAAPGSVQSLRGKIEEAGMEVVSCWAMGAAEGNLLGQMADSASADVNLLVSSAGLLAARHMEGQLGIPYVAGIPARGLEDIYFSAVREAARTGMSLAPFRDRKPGRVLPESAIGPSSGPALPKSAIGPWDGVFAGPVDGASPPVWCFIGEPVTMSSLAAQVACKTGAGTAVFGATEGSDAFLGPGDAALRGEEELEAALAKIVEGGDGDPGAKVVADPLYGPVLPPGCDLVRLPHLAFSGRIHLQEIPDLMQFHTYL